MKKASKDKIVSTSSPVDFEAMVVAFGIAGLAREWRTVGRPTGATVVADAVAELRSVAAEAWKALRK
jgi:hypothetical protein